MFSKVLHNQVRLCRRRKDHFETYFDRNSYEKVKNPHFHANFALFTKV